MTDSPETPTTAEPPEHTPVTAPIPGPEFEQPTRPVGRRVFLGLGALGALGIAFGAPLSELLGRAAKRVGSVPGVGVLPIADRWTIFTVTTGYPQRSQDDYRLKVHGLVDRPLDLSYRELLTRPPTNLTKDFQCVTGWRVHDVPWTGVLLSDLLDEAGVQPSARAVRFTSFDGLYTECLTLEQARRTDVLVAYRMEGHDITREHGGPVRLYVAPMYGYKSIKWLDGIEVVDTPDLGYWERYGYDADAWIGRSNGRDDAPV